MDVLLDVFPVGIRHRVEEDARFVSSGFIAETYFGRVKPIDIAAAQHSGQRCAETMVLSTITGSTKSGSGLWKQIFNTDGLRMQTDDGRVVSNFIRRRCSTSRSQLRRRLADTLLLLRGRAR